MTIPSSTLLTSAGSTFLTPLSAFQSTTTTTAPTSSISPGLQGGSAAGKKKTSVGAIAGGAAGGGVALLVIGYLAYHFLRTPSSKVEPMPEHAPTPSMSGYSGGGGSGYTGGGSGFAGGGSGYPGVGGGGGSSGMGYRMELNLDMHMDTCLGIALVLAPQWARMQW